MTRGSSATSSSAILLVRPSLLSYSRAFNQHSNICYTSSQSGFFRVKRCLYLGFESFKVLDSTRTTFLSVMAEHESEDQIHRRSSSSEKVTAGSVSHTPKRKNSPSSYQKPCDLCHTPHDVLVRCRIDETMEWKFVCTSKCWRQVSGGEIDGPDFPYYQYGGMWKNKHAYVSARKPKRSRQQMTRAWNDGGIKYALNDKVMHSRSVWVCRRSHRSCETMAPGLGYTYWKEAKNDETQCGQASEPENPIGGE